MSSRSPESLRRLAVLFALLTSAACDREDRRFREAPPGGSPEGVVRLSPLQPGPAMMASRVSNPYDNNAWAQSQGQRLCGWYNCVGCHANGGGGMGPPLMDDEWIYGSDPAQIYRSIIEGRPNGMPAWAGRIPTSQVWQIVAYVRSLGGLIPKDVPGSRADHMMTFPEAMTLEEKTQPRQAFVPPASKQP
jgi:cytochrome c oxidase cbb3-type subunit 3